MINTILIVVIIALIASVFVLISKLSNVNRENQTLHSKVSDELRSLDERFERRMNDMKTQVTEQMRSNTNFTQSSTKEVNDRLSTASKVIGALREKITAFEEGSKKITDIGKSIGDLTNVFKAQKMRGGWGEESLESLLMEYMPKDVLEFQYKYKSGVLVDAIVRFNDTFLPIDSKFPLENFIRLSETKSDDEKKAIKKELKKNIKKHIKDISEKYVSKEEKSLDVAFMYIPAENIYYESVIRDDEDLNIKQYCYEKRVIPVSPSTLYAYIQIVLLGMKGMQVSKKAKDILNSIKTMESEFSRVIDSYSKIGSHLKNVNQRYSETEKHLDKFEARLQGSLALTDMGDEVSVLEE